MNEEIELKINEHVEHDGFMPNVYPPRKMFSTSKVTNDNKQGSDMRTLKALGKAIAKRPLQNQKLNNVSQVGAKTFNYEAGKKYL